MKYRPNASLPVALGRHTFGILFLPLTLCCSANDFFVVEDILTGDAVRRGTTGPEGIPDNGIILMPNTQYRLWRYDSDTGLIGTKDFTTPDPGSRFRIPSFLGIEVRITDTPDSDLDGLPDEVEFIIGTQMTNPDTDDDGILDGAEIEQGLDPLDGLNVQTGIIASIDVPGEAKDVDALNELIVTANGAEGITVFNVFNGMDPTIVAQVDTPGDARSVAFTGLQRIVVGDDDGGVLIIDISDPPASRIIHQISPSNIPGGGAVQTVETIGDLIFFGTTNGVVGTIELVDPKILYTKDIAAPVHDVQVYGGHLYAYAGNGLSVLDYLKGPFEELGRVESAGTINTTHGRGGLFVGRNVAYLVHAKGYNTFDVSDPRNPTNIATNSLPQDGWKNIALANRNLGVAAVGTNNNFNDPLNENIFIYDTSDPSVIDPTPDGFVTPGVARDLVIYNGLAYVADHENGLQVINYLAFDSAGMPPTGTLVTSATEGIVVEGSFLIIEADVIDDVQVRNVRFNVNGERISLDGSYPFQAGVRVPPNSAGSTLLVSGRARDTGGNTIEFDEIELTVIEDTEDPVIGTIDLANDAGSQQVQPGDVLTINPSIFDNVGIDIDLVRFFLDGEAVSVRRLSGNVWEITAPFEPGTYSIDVQVTDYAGNTVMTDAPIEFVVLELQQDFTAEFTVYNVRIDEDATIMNSFTQEFSVKVESASKELMSVQLLDAVDGQESPRLAEEEQ